MEEKSKHIIFLGETRFPYGLASVQRMLLMSKALVYNGAKVTVVCRKGGWKENQYPDLEYKGKFEGVNYIYTSKSTFKPKGFINRNVSKIKGIYKEYIFIKNLKKKNDISAAIVSNRKIVHVIRFLFYSKLFGFPVINNLVEMASAMDRRSNFTKINDFLLDKWIYRLFDGAMPISDLLLNYQNKIASNKPSLKLPILCDYEKFNIAKIIEEPYFLYCGSINYMEVIEFILECYKNLNTNEVKMFMIVSGGSELETQNLQVKINSQFIGEPVKLFTNIPYNELIHLYNHAKALLIPLRPTIQDSSRFPHKIGEYLASANPVITTNIGEIKNYFKNKETALIANEYNIVNYTEQMKFVLDNPKEAIEIGLKGQELGLNNFDYHIHGSRMMNFINNLLQKN
ncbi:glycosyltransferase [Zobellia uliginosa]|uniref:glycosyltransferase n=1 Tax=Zobellia uliginosa TaxID=143224 RepID=UPI0020912546|nr:glycosyltransferase [Zobellia uliginosa]MBU2948027.1 glycosyltransferase [Zobellia uliginosa]